LVLRRSLGGNRQQGQHIKIGIADRNPQQLSR